MGLFDWPTAHSLEKKPDRGAEQQIAPWFGSYLIIFDRRPFAKSLYKSYSPDVLIGYCAIIALAMSQQWPWLAWWLDVWTPVVDILRRIIPLFDNYERALVAAGFGHRVKVIQHLVAFGWIVNTPIFVFLSLTVLRLPHADWIRFIRVVPASRRVLFLVGGAFLFLFSVSKVLFGVYPISENPIFAVHRYNWALLSIGLLFATFTMFGIGVQISIQSLKAEVELEGRREKG